MNLSAENTTTARLIIKNTNVTVRLIPTSSAVRVLHFTVINQANVLDIKKIGVSRKIIVEALNSEGLDGISEGFANIHLLPMFQKKIAYEFQTYEFREI